MSPPRGRHTTGHRGSGGRAVHGPGGQLSELCRSFVGRLSGPSEHLGQWTSSSYVGLSELCRNCRTVRGLSDFCRSAVGRSSCSTSGTTLETSTASTATLVPLSYHLSDPSTLSLTTACQLLLHGVAHHLAVLLVEGVGATHAGVLLEV